MTSLCVRLLTFPLIFTRRRWRSPGILTEHSARPSPSSCSPRHEFWPDNASCHDIPVAGIIGHRQVTDAYLAHLAHLARSYSARLATFDQALAKLHADVADLIPVG